jgi:hypothetical protein
MQPLTLCPERELTEYNQLNTEQLFKLYDLLHFIYPAKMERLAPVLDTIKRNWDKALKLNFPLFMVSSIRQNADNILSTVTVWQHLNSGVIGQHLASNSPVGSRIIFLNVLEKIIQNQHSGFFDSFHIYYRPQNKYSSRVFEAISLKAGKKLSELVAYNYYEVPFLKYCDNNSMEVIEINGSDADFISFVMQQRSELFIKGQELNDDDINLKELDKKFNRQGLKRTRKIFVAKSVRDQKIYGAIIINQSSLGFNFSFFENSSELILCKYANPDFLLLSAQALLLKASQLNSISPLQWLPVLIDPLHAEIIENLNGTFLRNYNLFIILKGGYEIWYDHIDQLTNSVYQRFINNAYAQSI